MLYTEINFTIDPIDPGKEIAIAQLAEIGFESFEETEKGVKAYIQSKFFDEVQVKKIGILQKFGFSCSYSLLEIKEENWNQVWESSYEAVLINERVYIRASFHPERPEIDHQILIDPKMSFGTAHHETTSQMIEEMLKENLAQAEVLDMGCGTGVLAILAEQLGARRVVAIDNDQNAVDNAIENVLKNNCRHTNVHLGAADSISGQFDVILANINKNILVRDMNTYSAHLKHKGCILFSGFYHSDLEDLRIYALEAGLIFDRAEIKNSWVVARFIRETQISKTQ